MDATNARAQSRAPTSTPMPERLPALPLPAWPAGPSPVPRDHNLVSLRRLLWLRWGVVGGQALMLVTLESMAGVMLPYKPLLGVFVLQALFNLLTGLRLRHLGAHGGAPGDAELIGQLVVDLSALSATLFFTGGATNPFVSFYLPLLAIAAAILPWRKAGVLAAYALACYTLLLFEYVPLHLHNPDNAVNYHLAGMWLNFVASAVMIAIFVARLSGVLRQREGQLNLAREQLLREARVEALNAQAAAVAHEIGTPLSTLAVIAGELRADASRADSSANPVGSYLADLVTIEQQLDLCRATLARLRADTDAAMATVESGTWLPGFAERWRLRHPGVMLQATVSNDAAAQPVDSVRVGQILTILLDNAARSQLAAGREGEPLQLGLALQAARQHQALVFQVADRGEGMAAQLRAQLGEAPVASPHGGQGIGAYLAQSSARQLRGRIAWRERPQGGTLATLTLPASATQPAPG